MTHHVHIESVVHVPADDVLHALSACGVKGTVVETSPALRLDVLADEGPGLGRRIVLALETLAATRRLGLVPEQVGDSAFVLRPPAA